MSFGDWDAVYNDYEQYYAYTQDAAHAQEMMRLIPRLRACPAFNDVLPGTSHATLFLRLPEKGTAVMIWSDRPGDYLVYLSNADSDTDPVTVSSDDILPTLQAYVQRIRNAP